MSPYNRPRDWGEGIEAPWQRTALTIDEGRHFGYGKAANLRFYDSYR